MTGMLVVTTNEVPGYRIRQVLGEVVGVTARTHNPFSEGVKGMDGRSNPQLGIALLRWREDAVRRMVEAAAGMGANAIVGMRFDNRWITTLWSEICAYGTAVQVSLIVEELPPPPAAPPAPPPAPAAPPGPPPRHARPDGDQPAPAGTPAAAAPTPPAPPPAAAPTPPAPPLAAAPGPPPAAEPPPGPAPDIDPNGPAQRPGPPTDPPPGDEGAALAGRASAQPAQRRRPSPRPVRAPESP